MKDTKKNQIIKEFRVNDNCSEMFNQYLAADIHRHWAEDFVNEENGEVVTVDRYETVAFRGTLVDAELLQELTFLLQSGDITSVPVTNQRRRGYEMTDRSMSPCIVTASLGGKKRNFFLYADTLHVALDIAADYIELNHTGMFVLLKAKFIDSYIFINHTPAKEQKTDENGEEQVLDICYYKIEAVISRKEQEFRHVFVLMANDIDDAKVAIERYISVQTQIQINEGKIDPEDSEYHVTIMSGQKFNIYDVIDKEFSMAYCSSENK